MPTFKGRKNTQVQISDVETDLKDKKEISDAVNRSNINQIHKLAIWSDVNKGKIQPKYQKTVASIISAEAGGSIFRGGSRGY